MIEVAMSSDIREIEPKILGPFTKRQIICVVISLCYGVPIFFLFSFLPVMARIIISILCMTPCLLCGWIRAYGMPLERFVIYVLRTTVLTPATRRYEITNSYEEMYHQMYTHTEKEKKLKTVPSAKYPPKK